MYCYRWNTSLHRDLAMPEYCLDLDGVSTARQLSQLQYDYNHDPNHRNAVMDIVKNLLRPNVPPEQRIFEIESSGAAA